MPKARIKVGDYSTVDARKGFNNYDGPVPPKGIYNCVIKQWWIKANKNNDPMFKIIFEIKETGEKAKYNGYAIWHNANLTEQGAPYVNAMVDALGLNRKAIYGGGIFVDADDDEKVVKIGKVPAIGLEVLIVAATDRYNDEPKLKAQSFAPAGSKRASTDDEDDDADSRGSAPDEDDDNVKQSTKEESDDDANDDNDDAF